MDTDPETPQFGHLLTSLLRQRELTRAALARRLELTYGGGYREDVVQKWGQSGHNARLPSPEDIDKIADLLKFSQFEYLQLRTAYESAQMAKKAKAVGFNDQATAIITKYISRTFGPLQSRDLINVHQDINFLAYIAIDPRRIYVDKIQRATEELRERFANSEYHYTDAITDLLAKVDLIQGMSFDEVGEVPPQKGRQLLVRAQQQAKIVNNWWVYWQAKWYEAEQHRKEAEAIGNNNQSAAARLYTRSSKLLDKLIESNTAPYWLKRKAFAELANQALRRDDDTAFADAIADAVATPELEHTLNTTEEMNAWPYFAEEHINVHIIEIQLRGLAKFGGSSGSIQNLIDESQHFPVGLVDIFSRVMFNYNAAQPLLRSSSEDDRERGLRKLADGMRDAEKLGYYKQLSSGQKILREFLGERYRLPNSFEVRNGILRSIE